MMKGHRAGILFLIQLFRLVYLNYTNENVGHYKVQLTANNMKMFFYDRNTETNERNYSNKARVRYKRLAKRNNPYGSDSVESLSEGSAENSYGLPETDALVRKHTTRRVKSPHGNNGNGRYSGLPSRDETSPINKQVITGIPDLSDPCFRRYANSIIVNAQPYERRSSISLVNCKAQCLRSQLGVYSCRSFVYDNVNQVCDLFAHVGDQSPARLLRFQTRDYFEPTAAINCQPSSLGESAIVERVVLPDKYNGINGRQQPPVSNSHGAINQELLLPNLLSSVTKKNLAPTRDDTREGTFSEINESNTPTLESAPSSSSCDNVQLPRFLKTVDFELYAHDDARVTRITLEECLDLCASNLATKAATPNSAVKCSSFEYDSKREECVLSVETAVPLGNGQLRRKIGTNYYEKLCVDEKLALECGTQMYARYPQMILVGFAETVVDAPTLQHCFDNCLNSRRLYGFRCISGMFYFEEPQLNCILNTEDRTSQPELFTFENSDLVDYFETLCQHFGNSDAASTTTGPPGVLNRQFSARRLSAYDFSNRFTNRDFVEKATSETQNVITVPVSKSIDALPGVKLTLNQTANSSTTNSSNKYSTEDNDHNENSYDGTISNDSWSAWTACEVPRADENDSGGTYSVSVNGVLSFRGTQTRRKLCGVDERICAREIRQCELLACKESDNQKHQNQQEVRVLAAQPTVDGDATKVKMAQTLRSAKCREGICCAVFGGCRVGVRRVATTGRLEWCVNPCSESQP